MVKKTNATTKNSTKTEDKPKTVRQTKKDLEVTPVQRSKRERKAKNYDLEKILKNAEDQGNCFFSPMLASAYNGTQDITNWYMSEKLDGIRCIWDGKQMRSRNGNKFFPPDYFIKDFPKDVLLDGELFLDRKSFSETASIIKRNTADDRWKKIKYLVFDVPEVKGSFEKRLKYMEKLFEGNKCEYIELHKQEICTSVEVLQKRMEEITTIFRLCLLMMNIVPNAYSI